MAWLRSLIDTSPKNPATPFTLCTALKILLMIS